MDTSFRQLGLNEQILAGVEALGFTEPTPVQAQAIPLILAGRDVIACAQTGTGKTAAFALPTLQRIMQATPEQDKDNAPASSPSSEESTSEPSTRKRSGNIPDLMTNTANAHVSSKGPKDTPKKKADAASTPSNSKRRRNRRRKPSKKSEIPMGTNPAHPLALIVTPTRELAMQIENVVTTVCKITGQRCVIAMGGTKLSTQIKRIEAGCDLLVATPGRLLDLMEHNHVQLNAVQVFVLDEADRMLDMGFWPSVRRIVAKLPEQRQTLLFSATIPPSIEGTVSTMLHDPARVEIAAIGETAETVEEHLMPVTQGQKLELLQALIAHTKPERILVFCRTKKRADEVSEALNKAGHKVGVMHSDKQQRVRERALEDFRAGKRQVLVATDVMSRGIDISGIDAVVNFDVPMDPEDYVHRIGRTGRAGQAGMAYTFCAPDEITQLREVEYFTKTRIPIWDLPDFTYDESRIIPNKDRAVTRTTRSVFSGSKARGRGPAGGRFGRHY